MFGLLGSKGLPMMCYAFIDIMEEVALSGAWNRCAFPENCQTVSCANQGQLYLPQV